jgi:hypothetical protein
MSGVREFFVSSYIKTHFEQMGKLSDKDVIRLVIEQHQRLVLSGGVSHRTAFSLHLVRRQHYLLSMYKLPATKENLLATVTYPCSHTVDSLFDEALCKHPDGFFQHREPSKNKGLLKNITTAAGGLMDFQVDFIDSNLMKQAELQKNSQSK